MYNDFKDKKLKVLIVTLSIFAEGLDLPHLKYVINVSANSGAVKTIQLLGRVLRLDKYKKEAYYIDFFDSKDIYISSGFSKIKALKKQGHDVKIIEM